MLRISRAVNSTRLAQSRTDRPAIVVVSIVREKLFGSDTIEEALKVVDSKSSRRDGPLRVLAGINDQEFQLIRKSMTSRRSVKGRFMSPLLVMCSKNGISIAGIGRKLTATSSKLSTISMANPLQFYKLLWMLGTKSISLFRTPLARPFLESRIPSYVNGYFKDASECMALKILKTSALHPGDTIIAVVPLENSVDVISSLESPYFGSLDLAQLERKIGELEEDRVGVWIPVFICYIAIPIYLIYRLVNQASHVELTDLSNFETEGLALGTWVRDKRRD